MKPFVPFIKALCFIPFFANAQTTESVWLSQAQAYIEWSGSAQGILPSLTGQLSIDAAYGFTVAALGDVNGDTYDDVAIGAPGLSDIITGSGAIAGVGAVFIYYGSSTGLPVVPSKKLQPTTPVAGALFGFSIDAGDITGDGRNDIIIGAPMDSYQTKAKGLLSNPTVTVKSGKVYIYRSEDLSATAPSPFLQIKLEGTDFFSTGVAGLLLSNISATNLFGYSVAVADDLNKDGKKDIIVGCPTYLGTELLSVKQGAAFVYYSNNLSAEPVQLDVPPTSLLGINLPVLNLSGLLFGYSVDGAGDYNSDGYNDVVVGAPAGINLSSLGGALTGQVLGGSAYVYYGKSTGGINKSIGTTLHAGSTGLLSNTANLFGYKVKGVKNTVGARTGNILIGAPLGGAVTNLLGGLQVKTGTVSVYRKKAAASGIIVPDQQLSSPRNDNNILGIIQSNLLFGFSLDNTGDMNCDGFTDIIIGEPASSGAKLIGANIAGGAAYIYAGKSDGTYEPAPVWSLGVDYQASLGVNVASLAGYSVAGVGKIKGVINPNRILVGAPGRSLDFGSELLNIGNTVYTLFGLVAGDNGIGKSYTFNPRLCSGGSPAVLPLVITKFDARYVGENDVLVSWEVSTEQNVGSYTIEKSTNSKNWQTITIVFVFSNDDNNSDNNNGKKYYSYKDNYATDGISYYRLKQMDIDNRPYYTAVRKVDIKESTLRPLVLANPFTNEIKGQLRSNTDNIADIRLTDVNGKRIAQQIMNIRQGINRIRIDDLSGLPAGVYILHVTNGKDNYIQKLVKSER